MLSYRKKYNGTLSALLLMVLAGCSTSSDKNFPQLAQQSMAAQQLDWGTQPSEAVAVAELTDLINIPPLNNLIKQAMANNPGLQQTLTALQVAYVQRSATGSDRLPELTAGFDASKEEDDAASYSADLSVSWELDLWQALADSSAAADKDIASSLADLQSSKDMLAANIMRAWLQISFYKQLLEIEEKRLVVLDSNESMILEKYRAGLGDLGDLDTAKADSASARARLAQYSETLAQNKRSLSLLLGQLGGNNTFAISADFPQVLLPLASLPKQDLARRPDLRSALLLIEAEALRTKAAYKDLLPSFSLQVALSDIADTPSEALLSSPLWSILGQLSAPLFNGGYLRSQAEIAELSTENAYWLYQETLLTAVNEVENALGQEKSLTLQQNHLADALASSERSLLNYEEKYRQGLVDISDLIAAQSNNFDVQANLVEVKYNRLVNRIDLGLALGLGVSL